MEDQEVMDQFLENKQGYVFDNINAVAGCGGMGVGEVMGGNDEMMGVKYEEQRLEKNDDDELKYVKEVQQSEKQQLMENEGDVSNSNELAEKEKETVEYEVGIKEENIYNQKEFGNKAHNEDNRNGHNEHDGCIQLNQVAEEASQSKTYNILVYEGHPIAPIEQNVKELETEEHSSLLMTNTTNGISHIKHEIQAADEKNNILHFLPSPVEERTAEPNTDLLMLSNEFETTPSQLNPEAKEFVPFFEPTLTSANFPSESRELHFEEDDSQKDFDGHVPSALPRRILTEDDFVAHSPRKGRGNDMETILVPAVQEFKEEADQRPHELEVDVETEDREAHLNPDKTQQASLSNCFAGQVTGKLDCTTSIMDGNSSDLIIHGSPDFDNFVADNNIGENSYADLSQNNELMKQSIYLTSGEGIECVLNSVQPIPTEIDSVNSSFNEELPVSIDPFADTIPACISLGDKESLQVEEKEHISKSPSTEEIQTTTYSTSDNVLDEITVTIANNSNNDQTVNLKAETRNSEMTSPENEIPKLMQSFNMPSDHYAAYANPTEEKYLMENTKELETPMQTTGIDQLMSEMIIGDDALRRQDSKKEEESCTMNYVESHINNYEPNSMGAENPINNKSEIKEEQYKDDANYLYQQTTTENDLFQNVEHSTSTTTAISSNDYETLSADTFIENAKALVDIVTPTEHFSSQHKETLIVKTDPDIAIKSEPFQFSNRNPALEDSESQHLLGEEHSNMEEKTNALKIPISEGDIIGDDAPQQNFIEENKSSHDEVQCAETTILSQEAVKIDVLAVGSSAPVEPAFTETRNVSAGKKLMVNKNLGKALSTKVSPSHLISSKKIIMSEAAKKPLSTTAKTKSSDVKTLTSNSAIDRKQSKPAGVTNLITSTNPNVRKAAVATTMGPKVPVKGNISARSTQSTSSAAKATTSKPLVSSRTLGSAPATSRKPISSVISSTAKANPRPMSDPVKSNTIKASESGTGKPKLTSPRATLSSQMRKPGQITTAVKSPAKPAISTTSTKTTTSSMVSRPKSGLLAAGNIASTTAKTNTSRAAPKIPSCATTSRRLPVGGSTSAAVTANTTSKLTTTRKSSPMKLSSGKTVTKVSTSNTKTVIKTTSLKPTENIVDTQLEIIGDISSTVKQPSNDNITTPERIALDVADPLQENLIGANDY